MLSSFALTEILRNDNIESVSCGSTTTGVITTTDGYVYLWGTGIPGSSYKIPTRLVGLKCVKQLSCGQTHAGCVTTDGKAYTWGSGEFGALGKISYMYI